jgi:hypothetical protein
MPPVGCPWKPSPVWASTGPSVTFPQAGITTMFDPSRWSSLLELAEACEVPVRWSCRTGVPRQLFQPTGLAAGSGCRGVGRPAEAAVRAPSRSAMPSATRRALAMIVRVGFTAVLETKKLESAT